MRPNHSRKIIFENNGSQSSRLFHAHRNTSRVGPWFSQDSRCSAQTKRSVPIFGVVSSTSDSTVTVCVFWRQEKSITSLTSLSATCLFDCLNNNFFRFLAREIRNRQVCDGFPPAHLCFGIDRDLANLYCYPRRTSINNRNRCFFVLGQDITSQIIFLLK